MLQVVHARPGAGTQADGLGRRWVTGARPAATRTRGHHWQVCCVLCGDLWSRRNSSKDSVVEAAASVRATERLRAGCRPVMPSRGSRAAEQHIRMPYRGLKRGCGPQPRQPHWRNAEPAGRCQRDAGGRGLSDTEVRGHVIEQGLGSGSGGTLIQDGSAEALGRP